MTNSEQALREFAEKIVPVIINASVLCNTEEIIEAFTGDLTALISEHYVSKEAFDEQKRIYSRLFDKETSCMYCEAKIRRGSAIILCKECAENTEG